MRALPWNVPCPSCAPSEKPRYSRPGLAWATVAVIGLAAALCAGAAQAQSQDEVAGPAELPPAVYALDDYVDSRGCVFRRAGFGEQVTWAPRLGIDRAPVCGKEPSLGPTMTMVVPSEATGLTAETEPEADAERTEPAPRVRPAKPASPVKPVLPRAIVIVSNPAACPGYSAEAPQLRLADGRSIVRCGPPDADPPRYLEVGRGVPVNRLPSDVLAQCPGLPPPRAVVGPEMPRYVQIGAFGVSENACRAAWRVAELGLSVQATWSKGPGEGLRVVFAGPFDNDAAARDALGIVRNAGFFDAFVLN